MFVIKFLLNLVMWFKSKKKERKKLLLQVVMIRKLNDIGVGELKILVNLNQFGRENLLCECNVVFDWLVEGKEKLKERYGVGFIVMCGGVFFKLGKKLYVVFIFILNKFLKDNVFMSKCYILFLLRKCGL